MSRIAALCCKGPAEALVDQEAVPDLHPDGDDAQLVDQVPRQGPQDDPPDALAVLSLPEACFWGSEARVHIESKQWRDTLMLATEALSTAVRTSEDPFEDGLMVQWKHHAVSHFLFSKTMQMSAKAEASLLKLHRRQHAALLEASACAALMLFRHDAAKFCERAHDELVQQGSVPMSITEHTRYDETPMKARVKDPEKFGGDDRSTTLALASTGALRGIATECVSTHVVKVLQTERKVSMLYKLPSGAFLAIKLVVPTWLQSLCDGKAETYFQALLATRLELPQNLMASFKRRQRFVCSDSDAAVLKCERCVSAALPTATTLHTKCEIHRCYNIHSAVFGQLEGTLSVIKHIALSLNASDAMRAFRASLRELVLDRLDYKAGSVPAARDIERNKQVLDTFLPAVDPSSRLRRAVIMLLANGDWLDRDTVVHHCVGELCCASREACASKFVSFFVSSVAGTSPKVWPQARWLGAEDAIGWVGLLQAVHGLLATAFCRWAGVCLSANPDMQCAGLIAPKATTRSMPPPGVADQGQGPDEGHGEGEHGDLELGGAGAGAHADPNGNVSDAKAHVQAQREELARNKRSASQWLADHHHDAMGIFFVIARVVQPLATWMQDLLKVAGDDGELAAQLKHAEALRRAEAEGHGALDPPMHHGLRAFRNEFEGQCLKRSCELMQSEALWQPLPTVCRVGAFQTRSLLMLSSLACQVHRVMVEHEGFPWKIFGLLVDDRMEADIRTAPRCLLDEWSYSLVSLYTAEGEDGLLGPSCRAELLLAESELKRETAPIESKHASIRRSLVGLSVQTHAALFPRVSAAKVTQELRKLSKMVRPRSSDAQAPGGCDEPAPTGGPQVPGPERRAGMGGTWRAFVREHTFGKTGRQDLGHLAALYRDLSPEAKARLRREANAAAVRRREGANYSFGLTSRATRQVDNQRRAEAVVDGLRAHKRPRLDELSLVTSAARPAQLGLQLAPAVSPWLRLLELKKALRLESKAKGLQAESDRAAMLEYFDSHGAKSSQLCSQVSATCEARPKELIPRPCYHNNLEIAVCEWSSVDVLKRARDALAAHRCNEVNTLIAAFRQQWARWHETIDFQPFPEVFRDDPVETNLCMVAGRCLCNHTGTLHKKMVNNINSLLKSFCPRASVARAGLASGHNVLLLLGQHRDDCPEGVGEDRGEKDLWGDALLPGVPIRQALWLHIGHVKLKPFRPTFQHLHGFDLGGLLREALPARSQAKVECKFSTEWQLVYALDMAATRWVGVCYRVDFHLQPVPRFSPSEVSMLQMPATLRLLWCPWGKKPRKKAVSHDVGWADMAEAEGMNDDGSEGRQDSCSDEDEGGADGDDGCIDPDPAEWDGEGEGLAADEQMGLGDWDGGGDAELAVAAAGGGAVAPEGIAIDAVCGEVDDALADVSAELDTQGQDEVAAPASPQPLGGPLAVPHPEAMPMPGGPPAPGHGRPPLPGPEPGREYVNLPGGSITWYRYSSDFVVVCRMHAGQCRKHKSSRAYARRPAQGRPLGWMAAWLELHAEHPTAEEHKLCCHPTLDQRQSARARLAALPSSVGLLSKERDLREGEGDEPIECP